MSTKLQNMLSRFGRHTEQMLRFQDLMARLRAAQKPKRSQTYKPAFSMGYRGFPRTMQPLGSHPAPTIDQVRNIERKYNTKLHVRRGLLWFRDDMPFSKEEALVRQHDMEHADQHG